MSGTKSKRLLTVFEALNRDLHELYIGTTSRPMHELQSRFLKNPPKAVAHWGDGETIDYHSLEFGLSPEDAKLFIDGYEKAATRDRWKVFREP